MSTILDIPVTLDVDARNMLCPMPLLKAKQGLNNIGAGQKLRVRVTDPASERDFRAFVKLSEHEMEAFDHQASQLVYILKKGSVTHD